MTWIGDGDLGVVEVDLGGVEIEDGERRFTDEADANEGAAIRFGGGVTLIPDTQSTKDESPASSRDITWLASARSRFISGASPPRGSGVVAADEMGVSTVAADIREGVEDTGLVESVEAVKGSEKSEYAMLGSKGPG